MDAIWARAITTDRDRVEVHEDVRGFGRQMYMSHLYTASPA